MEKHLYKSIILIFLTVSLIVANIINLIQDDEIKEVRQQVELLQQQVETYKKQAEHERVVYEQLFSAIAKGIQEEW